jgi:hypothetical protein
MRLLSMSLTFKCVNSVFRTLVRATPELLCDALGACRELNAVYRRLLKMALEELRLIDEQIGELDKEMASLLSG